MVVFPSGDVILAHVAMRYKLRYHLDCLTAHCMNRKRR